MNKTDIKKNIKKEVDKAGENAKHENPMLRLFGENHDSLLYSLKSYLIESIIRLYPELDKEIVAKKVYISVPTTSSFGDYTTNVALQLSGLLKKNPVEIATVLVDAIHRDVSSKSTERFFTYDGEDISLSGLIERAEVAGPGFVNIHLQPSYFSTYIKRVLSEKDTDRITQSINLLSRLTLSKRKIMVEFAHPNTHKEFHIGHLRNISIGESLVRILQANRAEVFRANYEGDVGAHVAKAIWGVTYLITDQVWLKEHNLQNKSRDEVLAYLRGLSPSQKAKFLGQGYAMGSKKYEESEDAKNEIILLNKTIYKDPKQADLWEETRGWSLEYFDTVYKRLGTHFDRLFFESEVERVGRQLVLDNIETGIFIKDKDGSVYFPGENYGLNNCVFVTKEDYATYEGKEVGLEDLEYRTFPFDLEMHIVANEQINFFEIAFEAVAQVFPYQRGKQYHLAYGMVQLKGAKLSSRTGQVLTADGLIDQAKEKIQAIVKRSSENKEGYTQELIEEISETVAVSAVKYSMLRVNPRMDIQFDLEEALSFDGESGPYLLYTYARTKSVLRKAKTLSHDFLDLNSIKEYQNISNEENTLIRTLYHFSETVTEAGKTLSPNLIASYLFGLAQTFNLFYNKHSILSPEGDTKNKDLVIGFRLAITELTADTLKKGLELLGIDTVERM